MLSLLPLVKWRLPAALLAVQTLAGCQLPVAENAGVRFPDAIHSELNAGAKRRAPDSSHHPQQVSRIISLIHAGKREEAREELIDILAVDPSNASAVELLADVSRDLNDHRLHRAALARLLTLQPKSAAALNRIGKRLLTSIQTQAPLPTSVRDAFPASDRQSAHQSNEDRGFSNDTSLELAVTALRQAVELEPRNTLFAQDLFAALIESGQTHDAELVLHEALQRNPRDRVLPMAAARLYESREDWSSAVFYYDVALRNDPANPVWRRHRAICHFRQGEYEKACADFSRSLAGSPVKPQLSEHLAWAEAALQTSDHDEAQRVLNLIVTEGELRTAEIEVLRGTCLLKQGHVQEAADIVLKAQIDWPRHAGLWKLARQVEAAATPHTTEAAGSLDLASLTRHPSTR